MTINKLDCFIEPVNPLVTKGALLYLPIWQVMCALILFRELRDESRSRLCLAQTRSAIHICGKPLLSFLFATPVSFGRFEVCGIPFHNIHKGLEFLRIHFRKIHLKKFTVGQHLLLSYAVSFLDFLTGVHEFIKNSIITSGIGIFFM